MGYFPTGLTFWELRLANLRRADAIGYPIADWSPTDWACAAAGEMGEACNLIKKMRRGEDVPTLDIARELADTVCYLDLLAERLGIDLGEAVREKFNVVSERYGTGVKL
ncbi:MAG: nucleotide pyrophosphohydrolase [Candidatus Paceibacterota bacterium]|jgi:NTP pyrophosphatase (non-canonical NTP hydrolase)